MAFVVNFALGPRIKNSIANNTRAPRMESVVGVSSVSPTNISEISIVSPPLQ